MECPHCNNFATRPPMPYDVSVFLCDFELSAKRGCPGCAIIATGVELCCQPRLHPDSTENVAPHSVVMSKPLPVCFNARAAETVSLGAHRGTVRWSGDQLRNREFDTPIEFFIPHDIRLGPSWPAIGLAAPVPETNGSEPSLQHLEKWLNRCRQHHQICGSGKPYTPRRILELGDMHLPPSVRLHEPSPGEELEYLCLSYRWSATPTLQTLKANVDNHKLDIPWDHLPLAFQQLCAVASRLRLRYMWIDALCIIQDDEHDKVLDIAVMDSIYEAAVVTIVSAWASGPEQGLFGHLGDFSHREFPAKTEDSASQTVCVRRELPHFENGKLPCLTRGWIYQELFLSPRLAFFLGSEIVWQCQEHTECQCSPHEQVGVWGPDARFGSGRLRHLNGVRRAFQNQPSLSPSDAAAYWWSHIEAYSSCQLTNPSDKLPAIQGLAARMAPELRLGSYIAGVWENSLLIDLAWDAPHRGTRPAKWRAPTWSWASIDGKVENQTHAADWTPHAAVTQVIAPEPRGVAETLRRGRIILDCHVREAWLCMKNAEEPAVSDNNDYLLCFDESDPGGQTLEFYADCDLRPEGAIDNTLWCAKILALQEWSRRHEIWLVLQKVKGDEYERVGCLHNGEWLRFKEIKEGWRRETIHLV
ncbi:heterokaryon incompatibility protein-domain-containing protein [Schizothecium vesticola]|uniref:Heterokaryon incompatibility protein-domain-containing protein n=1 Tax=Schizothecium vesticola TaxID=314040 RepID=A0AA40BPC4_9PEZI|nr:heterokaryon incompatibility protein-domain-containing protein [Schizothecium vesticola]